MKNAQSPIVMIGATGAAGSQVVEELIRGVSVQKLTLLGRRSLPGAEAKNSHHYTVDLFDPETYQDHLAGHDIAICTLGVGQPSKVSKDDFVKIDKEMVLEFAKLCKQAGIRHFQLLSSVGSNSDSSSFYLRTKGELEDGLTALHFDRLSIFQPSMILTPTNRYGFWQGVTLIVWPWLSLILLGRLKKFRGIRVEALGKAIARNILSNKEGLEVLHWDKITRLGNTP